MDTNELQVELPCACGKRVIARPSDAGAALLCTCGKSVNVPRLSELRALAGKDAYVTNPAEAIKKLRSQGINAAGDKCLLCGSTSPDRYRCHALCESSHVTKVGTDEADSPMRMFWFIVLPKIFFLPFVVRKKDVKTELRGHDVEVVFQLPVCRPCASMHGAPTRTSIAKSLMKKVPQLDELAKYYPGMRLKVERLDT